MFVFLKVVSGKQLSKLFRVCLPLEKLVNGKHFPVNEKHFSVKGKFGLVFRKMFFFFVVFVFRKVVFEKSLSKLSCVCLPLGMLVNGKHFPVKGKFGLVFRKVFSFYFGRKTLPEVVKKLEISYYLLIISIWSSNF